MQPEAHTHKMMPVSVYESVVPRPRGRLPQVCGLVVSVVCVLMAGVCVSDNTILNQAKVVLYGLGVGVVLYAACLLVEEATSHFMQRYNSSVSGMLRACVCWRVQAAVAVLTLVCVFSGDALSGDERGRVLLLAACYLLLKISGLLAPSAVEISEICESHRMNVAHGLAWSFYLGYLKLVLPSLEARVEQYNKQLGHAAEGTLTGPWASRLHILLPLNASVSARLEDDDPRVRFRESLPTVEMDRAGVRNRVYKNSVYSVVDANGQVYNCILESATPLMTMYQMSQESTAAFGLSERRQQVLLFYRTLQSILDSSLECRNRYRLILLDDAHAGEDHFLSTEILRHLQQQDREEFPMEPPAKDARRPTEEMGSQGANGRAALPGGPMSSISLMISGDSSKTLTPDMPHTLRAEPEENSEF
ncbi:stimulator of interferon genes protein isoform X2 [Alosa pseudoharengus]|uniref:stimulator of interferon genes protein isoform X2 n=1 Tax=Alosa pseudoharengus TaxID=34774 RepID=UPI003F8C5779